MKSVGLNLIFLINVAIALANVYKVTVNSDSYLNIRDGPDTTFGIIGSIRKDQLIYATEVTNGWAKFYKGYVKADYIKEVTSGEDYKTNVNLNFRTGPSTGYTILTTLEKGTGITFYGRDPWNNGWAVTNKGYCSMKYGNEDYIIPASNPQPDPKPQPDPEPQPDPSGKIELKTTYYNQCDFGDATYGPNGCGLCYSGCLVTSLTMMYNQVRGTDFAPTSYDDKMGFNGCLAQRYGPVDTTFFNPQYISQEQALNNLMDSLKSGRIAVFGSQGNTQHFVAVYGYTGNYNKPYQPKDFLIYDPGHRERTTLADHIANHWSEFQTIVITN